MDIAAPSLPTAVVHLHLLLFVLKTNCPSAIYALSDLRIIVLAITFVYILLSPSTIQFSTICISNSSLNLLSKSSCRLSSLTVSFSDIGSKMSCVKCKLPILVSTMEFGAWKDNPINTRTKIMVSIIP